MRPSCARLASRSPTKTRRRAGREPRRTEARRPGRTSWRPGHDAPTPLDPEVIRRDFPIFEREFDGRRLAYLDSAATALKPRSVIDAVDGY